MIPSLVAAGAGALGAVGVGAYATLHRNSALFGAVLTRLPGEPRSVVLTFDDGPNPRWTPQILDALGEAGVHATFFFLGRHVARWPALVRRAAEEGHQLANHGFAHRRMHFAGPARARTDIADGAKAIADAAGVRPAHFRAPHGFRSPFVTPAAASLGERTVGWSLGVWDSDRPGADEIARRVLAGVRPGAIVLLHDGDGDDPAGDREQTAVAVPAMIRELRTRGYGFELLPG